MIGLPEVWTIRRVLRTRYAAPIGFVDTSGGLAGLVLPFSNVLREEFRFFLRAISRLRFSSGIAKEDHEIRGRGYSRGVWLVCDG